MSSRHLVMPFRPWWLHEARSLIQKDSRKDLELAELFHRQIGATVDGARSYINRFKNGKVGATMALAEALCREYVTLPHPVLFFESPEESNEIMLNVTRARAKRGVVPEPPPPPPPPAPTKPRRQRKLEGTASEELAKLRERTGPRK